MKSLNREFNDFLQIEDSHLEIIQRYKHAITRHADGFVKIFYDYLLQFPATATLLSQYNQDQEGISALTNKQIQHLFSLVENAHDVAYQDRQHHIGRIHYRLKIAPAWIMGGYRLYQQYINSVVEKSSEIKDEDRSTLSMTLNKILFRDMGLMLDGYWAAATEEIKTEKLKVDTLQNQISDLLTNIPQIIWSMDVVNNKPLYVSPSVNKVSPNSLDMPIPCFTWTAKEDQPKVQAAWNQALKGHRAEVESRILGPNGQTRWFKRTFHPFTSNSGEVVRVDGIMEETTKTKRARTRLVRLATIDPLTGLANRTLWYDRVNQAVAMAKRSPCKNVVLMLIDLNLFKCINDTLGHSAGDIILRQVAQRLKKSLRDGDTLARMGGDEFGVLLPLEDNGRHAAETVAQKIQKCFLKPYQYGGHQLYLGLSVGIALYPDDSTKPEVLIRQADMAMYTSKKKNSAYEYYSPDLDEPNKRLHLISQMKNGLHNQEFELHFQPKIDLLSEQTNGFEALMRWHHPKQGNLLPDTFIPVAEKMGLIHELTEWALSDALKQAKVWQDEGIHAPVAVNLSAHSFQDKTFLKYILSALDKSETTPDLLELEITENTLMTNIESAAEILKTLSNIGIAIAIDDFGTGYSSLSYLKKLPIDQLKIDKSFVMDMDTDKSDAAIVRSVIDLGHNLGIKVVAEGVERLECINMLKELGCDSAQGFHIGRPMPINQVPHWVMSQAN